MRRTQLLIACLILFTAAFLFRENAHAATAGKKTEVKEVLHVSGPGYSRFFINLNRRPEYKVERASGDTILIEIRDTALARGLSKKITVDDGRVKGAEAIQVGPNLLLRFALVEGMDFKSSTEDRETFVIVIDIKAAETKPAAVDTPVKKTLREEAFRFGGYVKNETAYRISEPEEFTKVRNILYLGATGSLTPEVSYKASGRAVYDAIFALTDNYPRNVKDDQQFEAGLRETYLDISKGDWDFRLGKQQIVWGEATGIFFADVVNPKDLREFILPDFDYMRIPEWATDIEYSGGKSHIELVWIPLPEFDKLGVSGSEFPQPIPAPAGVTVLVEGVKEPSASLKNSELGARASYLANGWDLSVFHLYTWDKSPTESRTIGPPSVYTFKPDHRRVNISGATFAKEVRDIVLKGELVYTYGKNFAVLDPSDVDGVVKKDFLDYLLSADFTLLEKVDVNIQFMQRVIFGYARDTFREDPVRSSASIFIKTGFMDNRIEPEIFFISSLRETDMMIRPRVTFRARKDLQLRVGLDFFEGVHDGLFGQFDDKDRAYVEAKYDF